MAPVHCGSRMVQVRSHVSLRLDGWFNLRMDRALPGQSQVDFARLGRTVSLSFWNWIHKNDRDSRTQSRSERSPQVLRTHAARSERVRHEYLHATRDPTRSHRRSCVLVLIQNQFRLFVVHGTYLNRASKNLEAFRDAHRSRFPIGAAAIFQSQFF